MAPCGVVAGSPTGTDDREEITYFRIHVDISWLSTVWRAVLKIQGFFRSVLREPIMYPLVAQARPPTVQSWVYYAVRLINS